jgi:phosphohistidine phosphatase
MKQLTLVRHAKSSWDHPELADFERPLNKRGRRNAPEMGHRLSARDVHPDRVLLSPAVRARETADLLLPPLGLALDQENVLFQEELYLASCSALLRVLRSQPEPVVHVMLIGHNPGLTELWNRLAREPVANIPTCGVFTLAFPDLLAWDQLTLHSGEMVAIDFPKKSKKQSRGAAP